MVKSIAAEIHERKAYLNEPVETIYFGGGTPSLLSEVQVLELLNSVQQNFQVSDEVEITLEANPEDLSADKAKLFFNAGINRLSIGIQTFDEEKLKWMNRIHNSNEAVTAFENSRNAGFENISLDLIYAIPDHDQRAWEKDLKSITYLNPEHISMYGLTIEEKTVFGKWEEQSKLVQVPEDEAARQYLYAIDFLTARGYQQYEVSNFGKKDFYSRHNNAYWAGTPYLGVGPGAHSFDGRSRRFNVRNNARYLKAIKEKSAVSETEILTETQRLNEQILTQLRTAKGLNLKVFEEMSGDSLALLHADFIHEMKQKELIEINGEFLRLTPLGFLVADEIALRLFFPED